MATLTTATPCGVHEIVQCAVCLDLYPDERYEVPERNGVDKVRYEVDMNEVARIVHTPNTQKGEAVHYNPHGLYLADPTTADRLRANAPEYVPQGRKPKPVEPKPTRTKRTGPTKAEASQALKEWAERLGVTL